MLAPDARAPLTGQRPWRGATRSSAGTERQGSVVRGDTTRRAETPRHLPVALHFTGPDCLRVTLLDGAIAALADDDGSVVVALLAVLHNEATALAHGVRVLRRGAAVLVAGAADFATTP